MDIKKYRINRMAKYVVKHKQGGHQVMIWFNGKNNYLGLYKTEAEAIKVRDAFLLKNGKNNTSRTYENHYVDNKELYIELLVSKAKGKLTNRAIEILMKIVKGVNKKFRYNYEEDRNDVIAYSYEVIIRNWHNFEEDRYENAFAYFTEVIKRAHALQWKRLQKTRLNTISLDWTNEDGKRIVNI